MAWTPQPEPLGQLAQCLRDSLSGHDIKAQKSAEEVRIRQQEAWHMACVHTYSSVDAKASKNFSRHQQLPHIPLRHVYE